MQYLHKIETTICRNRSFAWGSRTYTMGILNVTPDSFSGDGTRDNIELAVERAIHLEQQGVDIIDIGGESTRRYDNKLQSTQISIEEELHRVIPVLKKIVKVVKIPISIDTYKPEVALQCLDSGANIINNVWGVMSNKDMLHVVSNWKVPLIIMHNQLNNVYDHLIKNVLDSLETAINRALDAGIERNNIIIDPGIGFGKTVSQNLQIENHIDKFNSLGQPILIGPSRKSHIGIVLGDLPTDQRIEGTSAVVSIAISKGADIIRFHDVKEMMRVIRMSDAIIRGWTSVGETS